MKVQLPLEKTRDSGTNPSAKFHRYVLAFYTSVLKRAECHGTLANEAACFVPDVPKPPGRPLECVMSRVPTTFALIRSTKHQDGRQVTLDMSELKLKVCLNSPLASGCDLCVCLWYEYQPVQHMSKSLSCTMEPPCIVYTSCGIWNRLYWFLHLPPLLCW